MRITGTFALSLSLGAAVAVAGFSGYAGAAKKGGGGGAAPVASSAEVNKLRRFAWVTRRPGPSSGA